MKLSFAGKIFVTVLIICSTFWYSQFQKNKYMKLSAENTAPILTKLPDLKLKLISGKGYIKTSDLLGKKQGIFAHLWGTWCGPCEAELPEFLKFAEKLKDKNVTFLLIAINDDVKKIKKFIKRFGKISPHIKFVIDNENKTMDQFGSGKVPETYVFEGNGIFVQRFVGPQNWEMDTYLQRVSISLSL